MVLNNKDKFMRITPTIGAVLVLLITSVWALCYGPEITLGQDTSKYSRQADLLIQDDFSFQGYLESENSSNAFMYFGFVVVIAISKVLLGDNWYVGVLLLNLASICLTSYIIFGLVKNATMSRAVLLCSILLAAFSIDFLIRSRLILTDTSYMFFAFCVFALISFSVNSEKPYQQIIYIMSAILLTSLILFYRPVTIVVFAFLVVALCEFMISVMFRDRDLTWLFGRSAIALCLLSIIVIIIFSAIMKDPSLWPLEIFSDHIARLSGFYKAGVTVTGRPVFPKRPETYLNTVVAYHDYLVLVLKKIGIFFQISVATFSLPHKILKYLFYVPTYFLSMVALISLFRKESGYSMKAKWTGWLAFQWIYLFAIYHALTWIDYTWRYRLPCVPPFIILASLGFYQIWKRFLKIERIEMKRQTLQ